jgi:hypothetical protein
MGNPSATLLSRHIDHPPEIFPQQLTLNLFVGKQPFESSFDTAIVKHAVIRNDGVYFLCINITSWATKSSPA